jgi:hypothetical protein
MNKIMSYFSKPKFDQPELIAIEEPGLRSNP